VNGAALDGSGILPARLRRHGLGDCSGPEGTPLPLGQLPHRLGPHLDVEMLEPAGVRDRQKITMSTFRHEAVVPIAMELVSPEL